MAKNASIYNREIQYMLKEAQEMSQYMSGSVPAQMIVLSCSQERLPLVLLIYQQQGPVRGLARWQKWEMCETLDVMGNNSFVNGCLESL